MDTATMTKSDLDRVADLVAQRVTERILHELKNDEQQHDEVLAEPQTMDFGEACQKLFHGKSKEWVKYWIMSKHPEILTTHGGWLTPARGRGAKIEVVDVDRAKQWMAENADKIRWDGKEPRTLAKHGML